MRKEYIEKKSRCHSLEIETIAAELETNLDSGLTSQEAAIRLERFGPNQLPEKKKESAFIRFIKHFNDILIYVLFVSAIVTLVLGHYVDSVVIILVAVVNALIGFIQENKAEKALEDIKNLLPSQAMVVRDGRRQEVKADDLTLGDVVALSPGDKVPADLRLARVQNLRIEESPLTGESAPSEKTVAPLDIDTLLGDRSNMAFSSTTVSAGTGLGLVTSIGSETEIGRINQLMSDVEPLTTPLIRKTDKFGKMISVTVIAVAVLVYLFGHFFRDYQSGELLLAVIGLAVAAIPEGLPAILSIILAIGVQNMAKRKAIIRTLPSVETLGSVTVICSDKTGTLTQNEMTVKAVLSRDGEFEVKGTGYAPEGKVMREGHEADFQANQNLSQLLTCFYTCNEAELGHDQEGHWTVKGDPTEGALLTLYQKTPLDHHPLERLETIPFDSEYKYMATLVRLPHEDERLIYIKGAPDRLLDMAFPDGGDERSRWEAKISEKAVSGYRIIGGALKKVPHDFKMTHESLRDIEFLGAAAIIDPPRPEAIEAVKACQEAGIRVKMITGDHVDTAAAIGRELGIGGESGGVSGRELEEMSPEQLRKAAEKYDIFARTSPENKLRLVEALQARNEICAMTGDGVNDAPALRKADVGIAMGIKGTEVTKDAAEMVLADDNFSTIVAAVEEGRRVYDNLKKTILFILPTNGAESFLIIASILFGTMLPLTPVQILWVNMVTSVTISLALAFEKAEPDIMRRPPRPADEPLLSGHFIWRILFVSVLIGGLTLLMNVLLINSGQAPEKVRTITLQTIVLCQAFHLFNNRSEKDFAIGPDFFSNKAVFVVIGLMFVLQLAVTYLPFMNHIFGTVPLGLTSWGWPFLLGLIVFGVVELEKYLMKRLRKE
ncbi:carbonate dehydratase [Deltaproteobacteria bacterium Smac51]|nr:carbonate dehydratase [Deltaproteobacteria bacterium Smac51]